MGHLLRQGPGGQRREKNAYGGKILIQVTSKYDPGRWNAFLEKCGSASIYHTPQWKRFLEETYGYKAYYFFVTDETGEVIGMLPLIYDKSILLAKRLTCMPFSPSCGYIGRDDPAIIDELNRHVSGLYDKLCPAYIEIRDPDCPDCYQKQESFLQYNIPLDRGIESVWGGLGKDVARGIIKSTVKGVAIARSRDVEDVKDYYELNCATKRQRGVPSHDLSFFKNLFRYLGDSACLYKAEYQGDFIAGLIMLYYKRTAISGYSAIDHDHLKLYPNHANRWESLKDSCSKNVTNYDFGRVSFDNAGLISFKKRWGAVEKKLAYSYYPKTPDLMASNRRSLRYCVASRAIRHLPMPLYKELGNRFFYHLV